MSPGIRFLEVGHEMASKRTNLLREYHLLIKREAEGFEWQIRYDRHAHPVRRSQIVYATQQEAALAGDEVLATLRRELPENT